MKISDKKYTITGIVIVLVGIVAASVVVFLPIKGKNPVGQGAPNNGNEVAAVAITTPPVKMAPVPVGSQTYQIMQPNSVMPKIVQATIDPVNVHVGDTQTLTIVVSDPNPLVSVVANIQTDNGTTTVPLALVGPAALNDVAPQRYFINAQNELAFVGNGPHDSAGGNSVAFAAEGGEKYSATWTVKDTHTARYHTVFTAADAKGNTNTVTLDWTDALCSWNGQNNFASSTWDASSTYGSGGCSFQTNETDGVEGGNVTIDAPITLVSGSALVVNPGYSITLSGSGELLIASSSQIEFSNMYCSSSTWSTTFSNPADGTDAVLRSQLSNNVFPGQTAFFTTTTLTNYGTSTWNYNCAATVTEQATSYNSSCNITTPGDPSTCTEVVCGLGSTSTPACGTGYIADNNCLPKGPEFTCTDDAGTVQESCGATSFTNATTSCN